MTPPLSPTQGALRTREGQLLPLISTSVRARVAVPLASVEVCQVFANDTFRAIEAIYEFPLPAEGSVHHMEFKIDDRIVKAVLKEKEEARRDYQRALREGRSATLLEQDQPSLFSLSIANVAPGARVEVTLGYDEVLGFDDGEWRFVFPMVAPQRYFELPSSTGSHSSPRVPSGERPGDVTIEVQVEGETRGLRCLTHEVHQEPLDSGGCLLRLKTGTAIANRDFVVSLQAVEPGVRPVCLFARQPGESGTFMVWWF